VPSLLRAHVFAVVSGYVLVTVMGFTLILLPMFSLAHGFDEKPIERAFPLTVAGTAAVFVGSFVAYALVALGYVLLFIGIVFYLYQIYLIGKLTVRKEWDVWAKSMVFAFGSFVVAMVMFSLYLWKSSEALLHAGVWFLLAGFVGFLIIGHLYKIVPFLVWFERFSVLVGKRKVPMLHEMYSKRGASLMFAFAAPGTVLTGIGLLMQEEIPFKAGASLMTVGAITLVVTVEKIIAYGKDMTTEEK
jgi:hypothetical protein